MHHLNQIQGSENIKTKPYLAKGILHLSQTHNSHDTLIQELAKMKDNDLLQILNNPTLLDIKNQKLLETITYNGNRLAIYKSVDFVSKALEAMAAKSNKKKNNKFDSFKNSLRFGAEHATADSRIAAHHFEKIIYECAIAYINEIEVNFNRHNTAQENPLDKYFPNHTKVNDTLPPQNGTTLNWLLESGPENASNTDDIINIQETISQTAATAKDMTEITINQLSSLINQNPENVDQFLSQNSSVLIEDAEAVKAYLNSNAITSENRTAILKVLHEHYNDLYTDCKAEETYQPPAIKPSGRDNALAQLAELTDLGSKPNIPAMTTPPEIGPAIVGESKGIQEVKAAEAEAEAAEVKAKKPSFLSKFRKYGKAIAAVAAIVLGIAVISSGPDDKRKPTEQSEAAKTPNSDTLPPTSLETPKNTPTALQSTSSTINVASNNPAAKKPEEDIQKIIQEVPPDNTDNNLGLDPTIPYDFSKYNSGKYFVWHAIADKAISEANLPSYTNSETIQKAIRYYYEQHLTNPIKFLPAIITANPDTLTDNGHIPYSVANNGNSRIELDLGNLQNDWTAMTIWLSDPKNIQTATQFYATNQVQIKSPTPEGSLQLPQLKDEIEDLTEFAEIIDDNDDIDNGWFALSTPQTNFSTINLEDILSGPLLDLSNFELPLGTSKNAQSLAAILDRQPTPNFSTIQFDTPFEFDTNWKLS